MVDVESDGPIPGKDCYSIILFGAVVVENDLKNTFLGKLKPISPKWVPEALAVSGYTREQTLEFDDPKIVMADFSAWVSRIHKPMFISDNNGYDWQFINWYFHYFIGQNPFGYSSTNLGSLYKGLMKNVTENFKHLRKTRHDHNPVNDATGNAEALQVMTSRLGLKTYRLPEKYRSDRR